ncbi:DNA-binding HxlR family transcriptional regulator [Chitinophaga dinghuensis]|uniref:DNA-binding HxlR family transcriptional regulator n=1 Tax=Chitinophaga dinghuensis TaxID=1539050 RepID=A0A327VYW8_9BACT|nr:helix-turn-helix domain-containing protein [Chitinophaga dinghuensis]RAJ82227.1 DNA-binding HxlR family transcriptional regulator [Chitinophaga dinghuensis]
MEKDTIDEKQAVSDAEEMRILEENNIALTKAMRIIGGKWKLLLLNSIRRDCPARFGELRKKMQDITHATLTAQLKELESDGIIERKAYPEVPPRVEYKLTPLGITLVPVIEALCAWGEGYPDK